MAMSSLKYNLSRGYIQNWLVAGPLVIEASDLELPTPGNDAAWHLAQRFFEPASGVTEPPIDLGSLGSVTKDHPSITWRYYRCREDHFVDFSATHPTACYLRAWAYAQLGVAERQDVRLVLTTNGPADLWLNQQHLQRYERLGAYRPESASIPATLHTGVNELLVRFEAAGVHGIRHVMALQVEGLGPLEPQVMLPTHIEADLLEKRLALEEVAGAACLERYVYGFMEGDRYDRNQPIAVVFPDDLEAEGEITLRVQSLAGDIFQERTQVCRPGSRVEMARAFPLRNGAHHLALLPPAHEYYEKQLRFERKVLFYVTRTAYATQSDPGLNPPIEEALEDAAHRRGESLYSEIAKMVLGRWTTVDQKIIQQAIHRAAQPRHASPSDLLGLLGVQQRFGKKQRDLQAFRAAIEASAVAYAYRGDEWHVASGLDAPDSLAEGDEILSHACEVLAGQLLPDRIFERSGKTGRWHRDRGTALAIAWLRQHGRYGFRAWDSPLSVEAVLTALAHLVELAGSDVVRDLASVVMDKIFFGLAVNSFQGAYGASEGCSDTAGVLSARLQATSGIARLTWGLGNYNEHVMGLVSLACCRGYTLPAVIRQIATNPVEACWTQERQAVPAGASGPAEGAGHPPTANEDWSWEVNKATYKTNDFMLSCAQDYRAGERGSSEHIWQATLGPDAVAFVNHPICMSEDDAHRPNLWSGNGVLPRAAQWGDVLISLYRLPPDDWLGFTHAYFPARAFDESVIGPHWAFARKGQGYLALWAARGLTFIERGPTAFRELRSFAGENVWLCHMGQALLDGSFEDFQRKILAMDVACDGASLRVTTLRGDSLAFAWEGPLLLNGLEQPLKTGRHFESVYCVADLPATQMEIVHQGQGVRLSFE